jgi:hypothetical protein
MRQILFSILLVLITTTTFSQSQWGINFDNSYYLDRISFDTTYNPNCLWQVGHPAKTVFTSAYSEPNAIMTDTINSVPPNDTSTFYLIHERDNFQPFHVFVLRFWYNMDGDSTDFGKIEISPNNGIDWVNVLTEDQVYEMYWESPKPTLKGTSDGWQNFSLDLTAWASNWGTFPIAMTADTIRFRFTYITDSSSTAHDGWLIDDFQLEDWYEGIEDIQNDNLISIYPNPAKDYLYLKINQTNIFQSIQIINYQGQVLYDNESVTENYIDISHFKNGMYFLKYSVDSEYSIKRFVINH